MKTLRFVSNFSHATMSFPSGWGFDDDFSCCKNDGEPEFEVHCTEAIIQIHFSLAFSNVLFGCRTYIKIIGDFEECSATLVARFLMRLVNESVAVADSNCRTSVILFTSRKAPLAGGAATAAGSEGGAASDDYAFIIKSVADSLGINISCGEAEIIPEEDTAKVDAAEKLGTNELILPESLDNRKKNPKDEKNKSKSAKAIHSCQLEFSEPSLEVSEPIDMSLLLSAIHATLTHSLLNNGWRVIRLDEDEDIEALGINCCSNGSNGSSGSGNPIHQFIDLMSIINITVSPINAQKDQLVAFVRVRYQKCRLLEIPDVSKYVGDLKLVYNNEVVTVLQPDIGRQVPAALGYKSSCSTKDKNKHVGIETISYLTKWDAENISQGYCNYLPDSASKWNIYWNLRAGICSGNKTEADPILVRFNSGQLRYMPHGVLVRNIFELPSQSNANLEVAISSLLLPSLLPTSQKTTFLTSAVFLRRLGIVSNVSSLLQASSALRQKQRVSVSTCLTSNNKLHKCSDVSTSPVVSAAVTVAVVAPLVVPAMIARSVTVPVFKAQSLYKFKSPEAAISTTAAAQTVAGNSNSNSSVKLSISIKNSLSKGSERSLKPFMLPAKKSIDEIIDTSESLPPKIALRGLEIISNIVESEGQNPVIVPDKKIIKRKLSTICKPVVDASDIPEKKKRMSATNKGITKEKEVELHVSGLPLDAVIMTTVPDKIVHVTVPVQVPVPEPVAVPVKAKKTAISKPRIMKDKPSMKSPVDVATAATTITATTSTTASTTIARPVATPSISYSAVSSMTPIPASSAATAKITTAPPIHLKPLKSTLVDISEAAIPPPAGSTTQPIPVPVPRKLPSIGLLEDWGEEEGEDDDFLLSSDSE